MSEVQGLVQLLVQLGHLRALAYAEVVKTHLLAGQKPAEEVFGDALGVGAVRVLEEGAQLALVLELLLLCKIAMIVSFGVVFPPLAVAGSISVAVFSLVIQAMVRTALEEVDFNICSQICAGRFGKMTIINSPLVFMINMKINSRSF